MHRQPLRAHALVALGLLLAAAGASAQTTACTDAASDACYTGFQPAGAGGQLHYYVSQAPGSSPTSALIAIHGHPRDANKTFNAALLAVRRADATARTVVVAPVFQVSAANARKCQTAGVPAAQDGDLLWTCGSWLEGATARGSTLTSFAALDALVAELRRQWPSLRTVTIAGFSAGAQMVQHSIGFAAEQPAGGPAIRYVVSDPGTWLYFDPVRPQPMQNGAAVDWSQCSGGADGVGGCTFTLAAPADNACPTLNRWKYGTDALPAALGRSAADARARYAAADIHYLQGALDSNDARGTAYRVLDKSCAAQAQGPYRLQRGQAYAWYDRTLLAPDKRRSVAVVPGCAHDVACVFPSDAARGALLGP